MSFEQDQIEVKFRLTDGSDIGPISYSASTTVSSVKCIIAQWPTEKENAPRTERCQSNKRRKSIGESRPVSECVFPTYHASNGITTMHVVIQQPFVEKEKKTMTDPKLSKCLCAIL